MSVGAPSKSERANEELDGVLGCLAAAHEHTRCVLINVVNQARPNEDHIVTELLAARREILKAKEIIMGWHPDGRNNHNQSESKRNTR